MNSMSLSKDDIETILINLNASKEDLCNRGLWVVAEEYQQLIDKILVNFANTLGEKVNEYVPELSPAAEPEMSDLISRRAAIEAITDERIVTNMDSVYDSELHRCKRATQRILAKLPSAEPERTAKVEMLLCGNCHESNIFDVVTRQHYKYCPSCGARLEWE